MDVNYGKLKTSPLATSAPEGTVEKQDLGLWLILFLATVTALDAMAIDMYLPAFPAVKQSLQMTEGQIQQTLSIFLGGLALGQGLCGPLLERYGRRTPLLIGLAVFVLGSVCAAIASSFSFLMVSRLLQAMGASIGLAAPRAIISDKFDAQQSAKAFSVLMQVMMIAPVVAPLIGTALLEIGGWRSVFWALAGFSGVALLWGLKITPETLPLKKRKSLNLQGIYASYRSLFLNRSFIAPAFSGALVTAAFFSYLSAAPFIFIQNFELTPAQFSYIFVSNALGMILVGQLNLKLLNRGINAIRLAYFGLILVTVAALGVLLVAYLPDTKWWHYAMGLGIVIASFSFIWGNLAALTMKQAKENVGVASGLMGMIQYGIGAGLGFILSLLTPDISNLPTTMVACGIGAFVLLKLGKSKNTAVFNK